MFAAFSRIATLVLLSIQLLTLGVGALPEKEACCCVARGKACKCKSHAGRGHAKKEKAPPPEGPCIARTSPGCGTPAELTLTLLPWVTIPEPVASPLPLPQPFSATLSWAVVALSSRDADELNEPPPRLT